MFGDNFAVVFPAEGNENNIDGLRKYFEDNGCTVIDVYDDELCVSNSITNEEQNKKVTIFLLKYEGSMFIPI